VTIPKSLHPGRFSSNIWFFAGAANQELHGQQSLGPRCRE
jgi:hypothetical protein